MNLRDQLLALDPAVLATRNDAAIAATLSVGRMKIVPTEIGDGGVALALGGAAGCVFLLNLEEAANTRPAEGSTPDQFEAYAVARQTWRSIVSKSLDVGNEGVRQMLDAFVGVLLTAEQADALKGLAKRDDPVSVSEVSSILNAEGI